MSRLPTLLRRFRLPSSASKADLKKAYLEQAKVLHPDVAGRSKEEEFKTLTADYEEALDLIGKPASASSSSSSRQRPGGYGGWQPPPRPPPKPPQPPPPPLTPAQRLRNVLLAVGGVGVVGLYSVMDWPSADKGLKSLVPPQPTAAPRDPNAEPAAFIARPSKNYVQPISEYYKKRVSKSTVRVRSGDVYVSTTDDAKSRSSDSGMGLIDALGRVAAGESPSEAKDVQEKLTGARASNATSAAGAEPPAWQFASSVAEPATQASPVAASAVASPSPGVSQAGRSSPSDAAW